MIATSFGAIGYMVTCLGLIVLDSGARGLAGHAGLLGVASAGTALPGRARSDRPVLRRCGLCCAAVFFASRRSGMQALQHLQA
jgi:hypothetical protein